MLNFIKYSKYAFVLSILITLAGVVSFMMNGLVMDIDFEGGNVIEVNIGKSFNNADIVDTVKKVVNKEVTVQKLGAATDNKVSIKTPPLTTQETTKVFDALKAKYKLKDVDKLSTSTVDPMIGKEIWQRGLLAMLLATILILAYIAIRFRIMSGFSTGTTAVIALLHDAFIMFAVYSILRIPVNSVFIAAVLTILGYSINDTIIVYDRIRENQKVLKKTSNTELVNKSISQTLTRSINTVVTVLISVITLYIYGYMNGIQSIKEFTLPLIIGLVSGAYSSIFIASPLWVLWKDAKAKSEATKKSPKVKAV